MVCLSEKSTDARPVLSPERPVAAVGGLATVACRALVVHVMSSTNGVSRLRARQSSPQESDCHEGVGNGGIAGNSAEVSGEGPSLPDSAALSRGAANGDLHERDRGAFARNLFEERRIVQGKAPDDEFLACTAPGVFSLLTLTDLGDGRQRVPADIVIRCLEGVYEVTVRCHTEHVQKTAIAPTWKEIMPILERSLTAVEVPWREYKSFRDPKGIERFKIKT